MRIKEQETRLNLRDHYDDDDDDDDDDDVYLSYQPSFFTPMAQIMQRCNTVVTLCNVTVRTETYSSFGSCQCRDTDSEPVKDGSLSGQFATRFCEYCVSQFGFCCSDTSPAIHVAVHVVILWQVLAAFI